MGNLKLGCSPLTGTIYAGKVTKTGMWAAGKQDVTESAPGAVAEHLLKQDCSYEYTIGSEKYRLKLVKVVPKSEAPAAPALEDKWISVKERLPEPSQACNFVIDMPDSTRHRKVYGGTYTGDPGSEREDRRNEFSTPGIGWNASHWQPSPEPPQR